MQTNALLKPFDRLLFVITLILVFAMSARAPVDSDMWWALRAGKETWEQRAPYIVDTISYPMAGNHWNSHSWLFDVLLYGCYAFFHYYGLTLLTALLAVGAMALLWFLLRGPALYRALMIVLAGMVVAPLWTPRPQMVSMLLLSLTSLILLSFKRREHDFLLWLPPLMILWSNLHAGYTLGLMAIGLLIAGELLDHFLFNNTENRFSWFQIRKLILVGIACGFAALLTPHGFGTWQVAFATLGMQVNDLISEWTSPDFHQASMLPFLFSVLLLLFTLGWSKKRLAGWELLTIVWFTYFAFTSRRQIGPYTFTVLPILGRSLWDQLEAWGNQAGIWWDARRKTNPRPRLERMLTLITRQQSAKENKMLNRVMVILLALIAAGKLIYVANPVMMEQVYLPSLYPVKAVGWMADQHPAGNLFNEYGQGGYLSWFLPEYPVYIDARADLFGDAFLIDWVNLVNGDGNWETVSEKWEIGVVLISADRKLAQDLHNSNQWVLVSEDLGNVLYVKIKK